MRGTSCTGKVSAAIFIGLFILGTNQAFAQRDKQGTAQTKQTPIPDGIIVDDNAPNDPGPGDSVISDPQEDGSWNHPYDSIQEAIDRAQTGETVVVLKGTYKGIGNGNINVSYKPYLAIRSLSGPLQTIIDGEYFFPSTVNFSLGNANLSFEGFTVKRMTLGGIAVSWTGPLTIRNCILKENISSPLAAGGGLSVFSSNVKVENCEIFENLATSGAGVSNDSCLEFIGECFGSQLELINCKITDNGDVNTLQGGGVFTRNADTKLTNCTIAGNIATFEGGGIYMTNLFYSNDASVELINSVVWGNGGLSYIMADKGNLTIDFSDIEGSETGIGFGSLGKLFWGLGNIDLDPLFVNPAQGNYQIMQGSPLIDSGSNVAIPSGITTDLLGAPRFLDDPATLDTGIGPAPVIDIGPYEFSGN